MNNDDERDYWEEDFNRLAQLEEREGETVFTMNDRARVLFVFERVVDEMTDSRTLGNMFAPYANIVRIALTDEQITRQLEEHLAATAGHAPRP